MNKLQFVVTQPPHINVGNEFRYTQFSFSYNDMIQLLKEAYKNNVVEIGGVHMKEFGQYMGWEEVNNEK